MLERYKILMSNQYEEQEDGKFFDATGNVLEALKSDKIEEDSDIGRFIIKKKLKNSNYTNFFY